MRRNALIVRGLKRNTTSRRSIGIFNEKERPDREEIETIAGSGVPAGYQGMREEGGPIGKV